MTTTKQIIARNNKAVVSEKGSIAYCKKQINLRKGSKNEKWAVNEYKRVIANCERNIKNLQTHNKKLRTLK